MYDDDPDTDPDVFGHVPKHPVATEPGYAGQDSDTVPRCVTCGRPTEEQASFSQGMIYALQGVFWMLKKRMPESEANALAVWFKRGIVG
jgi:hypothetical protein